MHESDLRTGTENRAASANECSAPKAEIRGKNALTWWLKLNHSHISFQIKSLVHIVPHHIGGAAATGGPFSLSVNWDMAEK